MKIYGTMSTRTARCIWAAEESGGRYEVVPIDLAKGEAKDPNFLKINPMGKVPALEDGDLVIFESGAICNYIGEKYPETGLTPKGGTPERARYDQWMFFAIAELEQPLWQIARHKFVNPPEKRVPAVIDVARWEWEKPALVLAEAVRNREFIVTDRFTMADLVLAHTLMWARTAKAEFPDPVLADYLARMAARPAFQRVSSR